MLKGTVWGGKVWQTSCLLAAWICFLKLQTSVKESMLVFNPCTYKMPKPAVLTELNQNIRVVNLGMRGLNQVWWGKRDWKLEVREETLQRGKMYSAEGSKEDFDIPTQKGGCSGAYFVSRCFNMLRLRGTKEGLEVQSQGCVWTDCAECW